MDLHPELRALRSNDAPQREAQQAMFAAMDRWGERPQVAAVLADLDRLANGADLPDCPALAALFAPGGTAARDLAESLVANGVAALGAAPLGHVPLRHFTDGTLSTLQLARVGQVSLVLVCVDGEAHRQQAEARAISFSPSDAWEVVLAGSAEAEWIECTPTGPRQATVSRQPMSLSPGTVLARDCRRQALVHRAVDGRLVLLRLSRRAPGATPAREYELATGKLLHQSAATPRDSRDELALALLGRMGRVDAAPHMAALARTRSRSPALRWQALRECLGLDTGVGFAALTDLACRTDDPLAGAAGALRAQLIEQHPQLAGAEWNGITSCPA